MLVYVQLQGGQDNPTRSTPGEFVLRQCDFRSSSFSAICGKFERGVSFLRVVSPLLGVYSPQGYAVFLCSGNPQLLIVTLTKAKNRVLPIPSISCVSGLPNTPPQSLEIALSSARQRTACGAEPCCSSSD